MRAHRIIGVLLILAGLSALAILWRLLFGEAAEAERFVVWIGLPGVLFAAATSVVVFLSGVVVSAAAERRNGRSPRRAAAKVHRA